MPRVRARRLAGPQPNRQSQTRRTREQDSRRRGWSERASCLGVNGSAGAGRAGEREIHECTDFHGPARSTSAHRTSPNHTSGAYLTDRIRPCEPFFKMHYLAISAPYDAYEAWKTIPLYRAWLAESNDIYINIYWYSRYLLKHDFVYFCITLLQLVDYLL